MCNITLFAISQQLGPFLLTSSNLITNIDGREHDYTSRSEIVLFTLWLEPIRSHKNEKKNYCFHKFHDRKRKKEVREFNSHDLKPEKEASWNPDKSGRIWRKKNSLKLIDKITPQSFSFLHGLNLMCDVGLHSHFSY